MAYIAKTTITHDGVDYAEGDAVPFTNEDAKARQREIDALLDVGAIEDDGDRGLASMTVAQLVELATAEGVAVPDKPKKADLIGLIEAARVAALAAA